MLLSGSQITWLGMNGRKLEVSSEGTCRICGGPLLGNLVRSKDFYSNNWLDEAFIKNPKSFLVCQPCEEMKNMYRKGLGNGFIATKNWFKKFETYKDMMSALKELPEEPYVLLLKTFPNLMRKHSVYFTNTNYNREYVSAFFIFSCWADEKGKPVGTLSIFDFLPQKVFQLIDQLDRETPILSPVEHGPEAHLASYFIFREKKEQEKEQREKEMLTKQAQAKKSKIKRSVKK